MALVPAAVVIAALGTAWAMGYVRVGSADAAAGIAGVTYRPVTFDEGFVFAARFARDGRTIVYSADWENQTRDLFVTSIDGYESRALGYKGHDLLSMSPDGALAILMDSTVPYGNPYARRGVIARASLTGGAPRRELDNIAFADFAADGTLAVVRWTTDDRTTIEWPQGRAIIGAGAAGPVISQLPNPRVSPSGSHIAFFACDVAGCTVRIANATGQTVAETPPYADWWGLAWAPGGREVWCAVAETSGRQVSVFALDLAGRQRPLYRTPGAMTLHDIAADGKVLAAFDQIVGRIEMRATPDGPTRDLSWKEGGYLADVSANGAILFYEDGDSGGPAGSVYVRRVADAEPVRISDGWAIALSPDGNTALVRTRAKPLALSLVPTTGLAQPLDVSGFDQIDTGGWLADGRLVLEFRRKAGEPTVVLARPPGGGPLTPLLPEGYTLAGTRSFAPDGQHLIAGDRQRHLVLCSVRASGLATCAPMRGVTDEDGIAGWSADSRSVFVFQSYPVPVPVDRVSIDTGRRERVTMLQPASAAVSGLRALMIAPNGAMIYNYARNRSVLYVISGLK